MNVNEPAAHPDALGAESSPAGGPRATRWYLAARPGDGGVRYAVYVDGRLITTGHLSGPEALAEAERILAALRTSSPAPDGPTSPTGLAGLAGLADPTGQDPAS